MINFHIIFKGTFSYCRYTNNNNKAISGRLPSPFAVSSGYELEDLPVNNYNQIHNHHRLRRQTSDFNMEVKRGSPTRHLVLFKVLLSLRLTSKGNPAAKEESR